MNDILNIIATIVFGLLLGVLLLFITFKVCIKVFSNGDKNAILNNSALAVLITSVLISAGFVVSGIIDPLVHTTEILESQGYKGVEYFIKALYYSVVFSIIALSISLATSILGFKVFDVITKDISESNEIKKGNVNIAMICGAVIFILSLMVKFGVVQLLESFVPYPTLPIF